MDARLWAICLPFLKLISERGSAWRPHLHYITTLADCQDLLSDGICSVLWGRPLRLCWCNENGSGLL